MINLIAILSKQTRAIGKEGGLIWDIPSDLKRFRELTRGQCVIMGRATWESLPEQHRPLPGRINIVITRNESYVAPGALIANSLEEALALGKEESADGTLWIIGGGQIYDLVLPYADKLYLTLVDDMVAGDAYFPDWTSDFGVLEESEKQTENGKEFQYVTLGRRASNS